MADLLRLACPSNASELAAGLITRFGSLAATIAAEPCSLRASIGYDPAALRQLRLLRRADLHMRRRPVAERELLSNWPAVTGYLCARQGFLSREEVRVLFLDRAHYLLHEERISVGERDYAPLRTRDIIRRALELDATGLILAHNHPSGNPEPSCDDLRATRAIATVAHGLGIRVHDHLIVVPGGYVSLRERGLL